MVTYNVMDRYQINNLDNNNSYTLIDQGSKFACSAAIDTAEEQPYEDPTGTEYADDTVNQVVDLHVIIIRLRIGHSSYKDKGEN